MKNSLTRATVVIGQLAVAAVLIQGCRTYTPGGRTALGGTTTELEKGTVVTLNGSPKGSSTVSPVSEGQPISSVNRVGAPGTYKEFIIDRDADMKDPHAGLNKSATKHVPAPPPSAVVAEPVGRKLSADGKYAMYVVKRGDSAGAIANRHGMTKAEFVRVNAIANPDRIRIGQEFKVSADGKSLSSGKSVSAASSDGNDYTVVSGDSLSKIAAKYGMRTSDLMAMNGIQNANMIRVGQKLRVNKSSTARVADSTKKTVSDKPATSVKSDAKVEAPVVEPIDTLDSSSELDALVGLTTSDAAPKSLIEAKQVATAVVIPTVAKPLASASTTAKEHTVQEGEDVFGLALKYNVRPLDIRRENNMTGSNLVPGSVIKIPAVQGN